MSVSIEASALSVRYGRVEALNGVSFRIDGPGIYGLLGRNGAGKSTLLATLAGFRAASTGEVSLAGAPVFENPRAVAQICLIREGADTVDHCWPADRLHDALATAAHLRPSFDAGFAERLCDSFGLSAEKRVGKLSRGQRAALAVTLGLACRAPVTLFDEPHLGLDAPARDRFYRLLLDDFLEHPRIILLSTHLIDEVASLFSEVLILNGGRLLIKEEAETLRSRAITLVGPAERVAGVIGGLSDNLTIIGERSLGPVRSVGGSHDQIIAQSSDTGASAAQAPRFAKWWPLISSGGKRKEKRRRELGFWFRRKNERRQAVQHSLGMETKWLKV